MECSVQSWSGWCCHRVVLLCGRAFVQTSGDACASSLRCGSVHWSDEGSVYSHEGLQDPSHEWISEDASCVCKSADLRCRPGARWPAVPGPRTALCACSAVQWAALALKGEG
eukprot:8504274-Alexandrium_andersonii.AAC.1